MLIFFTDSRLDMLISIMLIKEHVLHKYNEWSFLLTFIFNLHLKNVFTLKKSSTFANLLMEKPGYWVGITKKVRITPEEERNFQKGICIFTLNLTLGQFSVSACANQATGFSVNESSTLNGLFQTINWLKQLMGYSKRLHQLFHLKILNFFLTIKISYF